MSEYLQIILLLAVVWELAYHWLFWSKLALREPKVYPETTQGVSVVIAARNEEKQLQKLITTLFEQDHPDFEVMVVNDRSDDNSQTLLEKLQAKYDRLKVHEVKELPQGWTGKKHAVFQGIHRSEKPLILLTDADCLPVSSQWIRQMTGYFADSTQFILGFSPYRKYPGILNQWIQFETLHTGLQYLSSALAQVPYMGVGRNLAYRKELFIKQGFGGDQTFVGGDDDVFVNQHATGTNTRVNYGAASQMLSEPKKTWKEYFIQKIRHLSAGKRYHIKDQTRLGLFSLATMVGWLLFLYLLVSNQMKDWILILFVCRSLSFYSIFTLSGQKLNIKLAYWALPLFDLCYTISYPVVGLVALTAKRIKWS